MRVRVLSGVGINEPSSLFGPSSSTAKRNEEAGLGAER